MANLLKDTPRNTTLFNQITPNKYKAIVVIGGGNDICNYSRHNVVECLFDLHQRLSTKAPKVYIVQIINRLKPYGPFPSNYKNNLNNVMRNIKTKFKQLDLSYRPVISLPHLSLVADGIHMDLLGYQTLVYHVLLRLKADLQGGDGITLPPLGCSSVATHTTGTDQRAENAQIQKKKNVEEIQPLRNLSVIQCNIK